ADTFLASLVLAEVKGKMPAEANEKRLVAALQKTVHKMEKNQKQDGTFAGNDGWAPIFSQNLASKGLNRAKQAGAAVNSEALARADKQALESIDIKNGRFMAGGGGSAVVDRMAGPSSGRGSAAFGGFPAAAPSDAGVKLYGFSNPLSSLQEAVNTSRASEKKAQEVLADKNAPAQQKQEAQAELKRIERVREGHAVAVKAVVDQLGDKDFIKGFGSNGGEEFLSYLNIGETLVAKGGPEWQKWDRSMTGNLNRIQNQDGSWSGDHCITGRIFCTSSALLVLMVDRTPVPIAAKISKKN